MEEFLEIKDIYNKRREEERIKLRDYLIQEGFSGISERGNAGKGIGKYTSGKRLELPYDLSNWKYVEASSGNVQYLISLQTFDIDPRSHNVHSLIDRIGIYSYVGRYDAEKAMANMKITDIELPLSNEKLERLCQILKAIEPHQLALSEIYEKYNLI